MEPTPLPPHIRRRITPLHWKVAATLLVPLIVGAGGLVYSLNRPAPLDQSVRARFEKIRAGMSEGEVERILGRPTQAGLPWIERDWADDDEPRPVPPFEKGKVWQFGPTQI